MMKKLTLNLPPAKEKLLREHAKRRGLSLSRMASQAITADTLGLLEECQHLRQKLFELRAKVSEGTDQGRG